MGIGTRLSPGGDTYARGRVGLPEEPVVQLHTGGLSLPLELVSGVTLEADGVPRLSAVPVAGAVLRHARVIARGRDGRCRERQQRVKRWQQGPRTRPGRQLCVRGPPDWHRGSSVSPGMYDKSFCSQGYVFDTMPPDNACFEQIQAKFVENAVSEGIY